MSRPTQFSPAGFLGLWSCGWAFIWYKTTLCCVTFLFDVHSNVHLLPGLTTAIKGIVHPKMKILSSFTHPRVVPNLYECLCSAEHKGRYSEECGKQSSSGEPLTSIVFFFPTMEVNGAPKQLGYKLSSKYLPLCSAEQRNSYRFGTTRGWVNDDRIFIFGWTIPLMHLADTLSNMTYIYWELTP